MNTKDFDVQTSADGVTWTTAAQIRGNAAGVTNTRFGTPVRASYVRLKIITAGQKLPEAARVYEVGIYDA